MSGAAVSRQQDCLVSVNSIPFDGLNSFYQKHALRDITLAKLTSKLNILPLDGAPIIMVTHYVTIQAVANIAVPSGGAVLYDLATGHARELPLANLSSQP